MECFVFSLSFLVESLSNVPRIAFLRKACMNPTPNTQNETPKKSDSRGGAQFFRRTGAFFEYQAGHVFQCAESLAYVDEVFVSPAFEQAGGDHAAVASGTVQQHGCVRGHFRRAGLEVLQGDEFRPRDVRCFELTGFAHVQYGRPGGM